MKIMNKYYHSILLVCIIHLCSCINPRVDKPKELNCVPPPLPQCTSSVWKGKPFDTTEKANFPFLRIRRVKGADSDSNEWRLLTNTNDEGLLTTDNTFIETERNVVLSPTLLEITSNTPFKRLRRSDEQSQGLSATISSAPIHAHSNPVTNSSIYTASLSTLGLKTSSKMWTSHPAFTPDKKYIFFASDREGGFGGTDIWFARVENDTIFQPMNCGSKINTPCDEICPFITADGEYLYFSSPGHQTVGGYDIVYSKIMSQTITKEVFSSVENYGAPLNTPFDEVFPTSSENPKTLLFYSSNQPHSGTKPKKDFDVYILREFANSSTIERVENKKVPFTVKVEGVVRDIKNNPVADADVIAKDSKTNETLGQTKSNDNGEYSMDVPGNKSVEVTAQKDNSLYYKENINLKPEDKYRPRIVDIKLPEKIELRINFPNDVSDDPYPFVLDSNGVETDQTWQKELDIVAENIKRYSSKVKRIELVGHTDDVASDSYNKSLAQRRVNFVANELVKRGVNKKLLFTRSEGKQKPLAPRSPEDIETYRKRLRRVEIEKFVE